MRKFLSIITLCCLQESHLKARDTYRLKVKDWKKIFHARRDQRKAAVAILISDKIDLEIKAVQRDKEGHYLMIKGSTQEEDRIIINIYQFMGNRWGNSGNSVRLYFWGLQNHCTW